MLLVASVGSPAAVLSSDERANSASRSTRQKRALLRATTRPDWMIAAKTQCITSGKGIGSAPNRGSRTPLRWPRLRLETRSAPTGNAALRESTGWDRVPASTAFARRTYARDTCWVIVVQSAMSALRGMPRLETHAPVWCLHRPAFEAQCKRVELEDRTASTVPCCNSLCSENRSKKRL